MLKEVRIILLLIFLGASPVALSQHLSHQVLVPAAGVKLYNGINFSQTVGETAIEIFNNTDYILTQGFQQPRITFQPVIQPPGNGVDVYPNPATDYLTVKFFGDISRDFRIEIMTISGMVVITDELSFTGTYYMEKTIAIESMKSGLYFVRITSRDKVLNRIFKIEKI